ncbi:hypothetical protein [Marinobacter salarius]|uniref:hypothetical protein n=1 Tax=Marinobacter salarius TaxID=1420917 RepID=UPI003D9C5B08
MSAIFYWVFRLLVLIVAGIFVFRYLDAEIIFSAHGIYAVFLYFILSLISGVRYKNLVYYSSGQSISYFDVFRIPAAMNLASYLFPVKGGGVWLFFYLKNRYGFSSKKSFLLAAFNLLFLGYLLVVFLLIFFSGFELRILGTLFLLGGYFLILVLVKILLRITLGYFLSWRFNIIDSFLVVFHFFILSWLCYILVGPISLELSFFLALFLLVSAFIKITPGNIGVLEGGAVIAAQAIPHYGDTFLALAASYRSLSILHAIVAGAPSMLSLSLNWKGQGHY